MDNFFNIYKKAGRHGLGLCFFQFPLFLSQGSCAPLEILRFVFWVIVEDPDLTINYYIIPEGLLLPTSVLKLFLMQTKQCVSKTTSLTT
jgi:hypothetical protein